MSKKESKSEAGAKSNAIVIWTEPKFNDLNKSIETLGQFSGNLSKEEKEIGFKILGEWEEKVIRKIEDKASKFKSILSYFNVGSYYNYLRDEERAELEDRIAEITETTQALNKIRALELAAEVHNSKEPMRPIVNPDMTIAENDENYVQYSKDKILYDIESKRLNFKVERAKKEWKEAICELPVIKNMVEDMQSYLRKVTRFRDECSDKAHLAKLNLAISDEKIRESIKDLVNFSASL